LLVGVLGIILSEHLCTLKTSNPIGLTMLAENTDSLLPPVFWLGHKTGGSIPELLGFDLDH